jgi:hypothetical protein
MKKMNLKNAATIFVVAIAVALVFAFVACDSVEEDNNRTADCDCVCEVCFPPPSLLEQMVIDNVLVASYGNINIYASDMSFRIQEAESQLTFEERTEMDEDELEQKVLRESVKFALMFLMFEEYAQEHGIEIPEDTLEDMLGQIEDWYEDESFEEMVFGLGYFNREQVTRYILLDTLFGEVIRTVMENDELFAEFESFMPENEDVELIGAKHILVILTDFEDEDDIINFDDFDDMDEFFAAQEAATERTTERAMAFAMELYERAVAGEDFDMLIETYGNDPGMERSPEGYTFLAGAMVEEFEAKTLSLEIGEIGEPVAAPHGIHIIKRIEPNPDAEDIMRPWDSPFLTRGQRKWQAVVFAFEDRVENAEIDFKDKLFEISVFE